MIPQLESAADIFLSWRVVRFEQEGSSYLLCVTAELVDGSHLSIRDYVFQDGTRKYAYHWMERDGSTRCRWDNAPHWPGVATFPHHLHDSDQIWESTITDVESLLGVVRQRLKSA